jgi:hypothetical protein
VEAVSFVAFCSLPTSDDEAADLNPHKCCIISFETTGGWDNVVDSLGATSPALTASGSVASCRKLQRSHGVAKEKSTAVLPRSTVTISFKASSKSQGCCHLMGGFFSFGGTSYLSKNNSHE